MLCHLCVDPIWPFWCWKRCWEDIVIQSPTVMKHTSTSTLTIRLSTLHQSLLSCSCQIGRIRRSWWPTTGQINLRCFSLALLDTDTKQDPEPGSVQRFIFRGVTVSNGSERCNSSLNSNKKVWSRLHQSDPRFTGFLFTSDQSAEMLLRQNCEQVCLASSLSHLIKHFPSTSRVTLSGLFPPDCSYREVRWLQERFLPSADIRLDWGL